MGIREALVLVAIGGLWLARGWLAGAGEGLRDFVVVRGDLTGQGQREQGGLLPKGCGVSGCCCPSSSMIEPNNHFFKQL